VQRPSLGSKICRDQGLSEYSRAACHDWEDFA
jgi:hypothetical protein